MENRDSEVGRLTPATSREKRWTWIAVLCWLAATNILLWTLYHGA